MTETDIKQVAWWARGLLFENCSCQLVCPGHMHFEQFCTQDRCKGFWAVRVDEGELDGTRLDHVKAVLIYDTPRHMIDGNWTEALVIDEAASAPQRQAMEAILKGRVGGPWAVLGRFVGRWLDTRYAPIQITDEDTTKRVGITGLLEGAITNIRGRDRTSPVRFENIFNQIHAPSQVIAKGGTDCEIGEIVVHNNGTHGLHSKFEWIVNPS